MSEFLLKRQLKFSSTAVMASPHVSRKDRVSVCRLKDRTLLQLKPSQDQQVLWTTRGVIGLQMGPPSQHMREWLGTSTGSGSSPEPSPRRPNTCKLGTKLSFFPYFWKNKQKYMTDLDLLQLFWTVINTSGTLLSWVTPTTDVFPCWLLVPKWSIGPSCLQQRDVSDVVWHPNRFNY